MNYTFLNIVSGEQYIVYTKKKFAWPSDRSLEEIVPVYIRFRVFDVHSSYIDTYYTVWVGRIEIPFNPCKVISFIEAKSSYT